MARSLVAWFLALSSRELGNDRQPVAEAARIAQVDWHEALGLVAHAGTDLKGMEISVEMGQGAAWVEDGAGKASACGIQFQRLTANDMREDHKLESKVSPEGWYVVSSNPDSNGEGCTFSEHAEKVLRTNKVTLGMRLEGAPGDMKFGLSYIPAVIHYNDVAAEPRLLDVGLAFPEHALECEADQVGVHCTTYLFHCVAWIWWKQPKEGGGDCNFKSMIDLTSLSAAMKDANHGGTKGEGFDQLLDRVKMEYAAYEKAQQKLTGFRVKTYKLDKPQKKEGWWNRGPMPAKPGTTMREVLYHVYSFAKFRGWYTQSPLDKPNNCQMFAAWLASRVAGETLKAAYWLLFSPVEGVPMVMPEPQKDPNLPSLQQLENRMGGGDGRK